MRQLTPAFAASLAAHLALLVALAATFGVQPAAMRDSLPALSLMLVPQRTQAPAEAETPPAPAPVASPLRRSPETPAVLPPSAPRVTDPATAETPPAPDAVAPAMPPASSDARVEFATSAVLGRLGDALQMRSLFEFPAEIEVPVRPADAIDVQYPPAALEERREATVVAWVIVDADGRVEEISIPEGGPEFGEAVQNALLTARFLPAQDGGKPIRYFTMLEFKFRLGSSGATLVPDQPR